MTDVKRLLDEATPLPWESLYMTGPNCWQWTGTHDEKGYGRWWDGKRPKQAHRLVYESLVGAIPDGMTLDHLCRNRSCVRPDHLEPVTNVENVMRGESLPAQNARKDACDHGHAFTEANTYIHPTTGFRYCRQCRKERAQARRDRDAAFLARRPDYEAAVDALDALLRNLWRYSFEWSYEEGEVDVEEAARAALARLREQE